MNTSEFHRQNDADYSAISELQRNMEKLLTMLDKEAPAYAKACQIDEFMSDRRKSALADAFVAIRAASPEESAGSAEHRARASAGFKTKMQGLIKDQLTAETVKANYHVIQTRLEIARSFLAFERAKIERL